MGELLDDALLTTSFSKPVDLGTGNPARLDYFNAKSIGRQEFGCS